MPGIIREFYFSEVVIGSSQQERDPTPRPARFRMAAWLGGSVGELGARGVLAGVERARVDGLALCEEVRPPPADMQPFLTEATF